MGISVTCVAHRAMAGEWYKQTYAYSVFSVGMCGYIGRFFWDLGDGLDHKLLGTFMAVMGMFQVLLNIGLIGDMWDKKNNRRPEWMRPSGN